MLYVWMQCALIARLNFCFIVFVYTFVVELLFILWVVIFDSCLFCTLCSAMLVLVAFGPASVEEAWAVSSALG